MSGKRDNLDLDDLLTQHVGQFGRYQKLRFLLYCLPCLLVSMEVFAWTFTGAVLPNRCILPDEPANASFSYAKDEFSITDKKLIKCHRPKSVLAIDNGTWPSNQSETCVDGYKWDHSEIAYSAVDRWDLVCSMQWSRSFIQSLFFVGQFVGALLWGYVGDKYGRKICLVACIFIQLVFGVISAYVPFWYLYAIVRFILGTCHPGTTYTAVLMSMELVGPTRRMIALTATGICFAGGELILGGVAYLLRNYQHLQLAISLPGVFFLGYWWLLPESFRWLVSQRRYQEADQILQVIAKENGTKVPDHWQEHLEFVDTNHAKLQYAADSPQLSTWQEFKLIFLSPILRRRILVAWFSFIAASCVFYGLSTNPSLEGGDRYVTFALSAGIEFLAIAIFTFGINYTGRKFMTMLAFFIVGAFMSLSLLVPQHLEAVMIGCVILSKCGAKLAFMCCILYMPELFPTGVRSRVTGSCSAWARVGSIGASWLADYLANQSTTAVVAVFAAVAFQALVLLFLLPETTGKKLPETFAAAESLGADQTWRTTRWTMRRSIRKHTNLVAPAPNGELSAEESKSQLPLNNFTKSYYSGDSKMC